MPLVESGLLGGRTPYIRGGEGPREAVLFFGINALFRRLDRTPRPERYARQVAKILPGFRFTILGYASSSFEDIVRDMADAIPRPPDLLMGVSFGGFVAMRFAAEHPELVKRVVLLTSAHRLPAAGRRMVDRQLAALERGDLRTLMIENALLFRRPWYNWLVRLKIWKDGPRLADGFRDPAAILHDYRLLFGPGFEGVESYARRVRRPALVIGGTADQVFDREAFEETARVIPGARLELFEGETHMLPIERSADVAAVIADYTR